ncbi:MAG TPA: asparagine synthase (glutamine-hydrolyzing) [Solirubrobacteraceae bacterium]|nr:asparagine synthase (glutamine-hydrolyzing) [Solirubrobacteraceae bacterium]
MCGICGSYDFAHGREADRAVLERMNASLIHRGPDADGCHIDGAVGLAARRLAIIDLEHGDQPMLAADGAVCVVQNGEILNHLELRATLERDGVRFRTRCDTEVLLHLYLRDGPGFVSQLRGMFALALWDRRERRLVLARDRYGIKPLYYGLANGRLTFASELKALLRQPSFSRDVDIEALHSFLAFNSIPAPLTIFRAARKLPAGHLLVCGPSGVTLNRYARPAPAPTAELRRESAEALAGDLRARLRESVKAHLLADVPVGVLLSGGVDSSVLAALASEASPQRVSTFSIGFKERSFNELDLARQVARRYGTDHHELVVSPQISELLPKLVASFDEPFADSSAVPTYLVCKLAAEHVKVVLSGEGGDELFGGYETYSAHQLAQRIGPAASRLRPLIELLPSSSSRVSLDYRAKRFVRAATLPPLERHHGFKEIFSPSQRERLLAPQWRSHTADPLEAWRLRFAETEGAPLLARLQDVDLGIYLADDLLVKTDRASMAHSLEARVPYLDPTVSDLALALPSSMKVRGLSKKRLLRRAARPLVPASIVRARKRGFSIPAAAWLRGELKPLAQEVLSPTRVRAQGYFEPTVVSELLEAHCTRQEDYSRQLWGLMSFSLWAEQVAASPAGNSTLAPVTVDGLKHGAAD